MTEARTVEACCKDPSRAFTLLAPILAAIEPWAFTKLALFYTLILQVEGITATTFPGIISVADHLRVLHALIDHHVDVDYAELTGGLSPLAALVPAVNKDNILALADIAACLPDKETASGFACADDVCNISFFPQCHINCDAGHRPVCREMDTRAISAPGNR